jgi:hypothetical protein
MPPLIPAPLWDLMLSTNDCCPGCSCEADRFEITSQRVASWVARYPAESRQALAQLEALAGDPALDLVGLSDQTNVHFDSPAVAAEWLGQWLRVLRQTAGANQ